MRVGRWVCHYVCVWGGGGGWGGGVSSCQISIWLCRSSGSITSENTLLPSVAMITYKYVCVVVSRAYSAYCAYGYWSK